MDKEKYCILENDGVALCVCKHRPCKQLKRLQAENEQLKNDIETGTICVTCTKENENCRLQAENERLKSALVIWENATLKQTALKVVEVDKYRQALQEIREIARNEVETRMLFADEKSFCDFNNILTKINEVIGAE